MIKKLLIPIICLVFTANIYAQDSILPIDEVSEKFTYKEVVTEEGNSDELYARGSLWLGKAFKNAAGKCSKRDAVEKIIILTDRMRVYPTVEEGETALAAYTISYTLTIEFKEGRYRYTFTDFNVKRASYFPLERWLDTTDPSYDANADKYFFDIDTFIKEKIASMKEGMKPEVVIDDSW